VARELQNRVLALAEEVLGQSLEREICPDWLVRPGKDECGSLWPTIQSVYNELTGGELPDVMRKVESRKLDAVVVGPDDVSRVFEVDESQHFNPFRAATFRHYLPDTLTAFDRESWLTRSAAATKLRGGGYARAMPPLFPDAGGRHLQRAFRDALADLVPTVHGWAPTLRVADWEVLPWLHSPDASHRMGNLLAGKGIDV
jgi:hypothetical protein